MGLPLKGPWLMWVLLGATGGMGPVAAEAVVAVTWGAGAAAANATSDRSAGKVKGDILRFECVETRWRRESKLLGIVARQA